MAAGYRRGKASFGARRGGVLVFEKNPISPTGAVDYVNEFLKVRHVSSIGLCVREGTKYKDVIRALDVRRETNATNIGVSMQELPVGRDP